MSNGNMTDINECRLAGTIGKLRRIETKDGAAMARGYFVSQG